MAQSTACLKRFVGNTAVVIDWTPDGRVYDIVSSWSLNRVYPFTVRACDQTGRGVK